MRTFIQKPKPVQQSPSAKPRRPQSGHSPQVKSISPHARQDFSLIPIHPPAAGAIQTKLAINNPGDNYEQEADRVTKQVMGTPEPLLQRACSCGGGCPKCQTAQLGREHLGLQTKRIQASDAGPIAAPPMVHEVLRSPGHPLDAATRAFMEPRFDYDFSRVQVHSDAAAERSAQDVNAHAYTAGNSVVFGPGRYSPGTEEGRRLIAHELTHVVQQSGSALAVQRQPAGPDPSAARASAVAEAEAVAGTSVEQVEEQALAEVHYRLDSRRSRDKRYALTQAARDKARIQKRGTLTDEHQHEITVKMRFFEGEAKAAYLRTLSAVLSEFPDQAAEILAAPVSAGTAGVKEKPELACDAGKKQFVLDYEGEPEKTRCMDVMTDPEYKHNLFDANIESAVGYAVPGTTWGNIEYNRFKVMLVKYKNGTSEYFMLDDVGNFYYSGKTLAILEFSYLKRKNGLVYPVVNDQIYFNEILTPRILKFKNGLKYQVKDLQSLYTLLEATVAFAGIVAAYGIVEGFRASLQGFRKSKSLPGRTTQPSRTLGPGSESETSKVSGVPEEVSDETTTGRIRPGERIGEVVGDFNIVGEKGLVGDSFERDIRGLINLKGRQTDIRPIQGLVESFIQEAKAAGAKRLKIRGLHVGNENVMRIRRFAQLHGGTATVTGEDSIELNIPLK